MKIFLDLLPIFLFFASYKWGEGHKAEVAQWMSEHLGFMVSGGVVGPTEAPVLLATVVVMLGTLLQIAILKSLRQKIDKMLWAGLVIVVVLGGMTLWFHDKTFIQWKPSVIYWMMALGFFVSEIILGKKALAAMMGGQIDAPDAVWRRLGWAWVAFFVFMGLLNAYVFKHYTEEQWVSFKMWGSLGLTLAFTVAQGMYLSKHMKQAA